MRQKSGKLKEPAEKVVRDIRRATRKQYSAEEKIRIVLGGLRGEDSIAELCRREGIAQSLYYSWSKEFLEAGKKRLAGDTAPFLTLSIVVQPTAIALTYRVVRQAGMIRRVFEQIASHFSVLKLGDRYRLMSLDELRGRYGVLVIRR
jgi:transposase